MGAPRIILFDWDSTLVDNWDSVIAAWNMALETLNKPAMARDEAIMRAGRPPQENFIEVFGEDWQGARSIFYEVMSSPESKMRLKALPGSEDMLCWLAGQGISLGIVSNKNGIVLRQEIARLGWDGYFAVSVGSGDAAFDKPNPDPILYAFASLSADPGMDVWMVGDMHADIESACRAGVVPVLIETTARLGRGLEGNLDTHKPRWRVSDAAALVRLVEEASRTI
jgi:phosphoglycolate phosphatase